MTHSKESYLGSMLKVHRMSFCVPWNKYHLSPTLVLHLIGFQRYLQLFHKIPSVFNGYVLFKVTKYSDTALLSLSKLDPENTMKVLRMVGGLNTNGRLMGRPMRPEDAPEDSNSPRRLTAHEKWSSVSLHMQRPVTQCPLCVTCEAEERLRRRVPSTSSAASRGMSSS